MIVTVIHSVELITDGARTRNAWVRFESEVVVATGSGDSWRAPGADREHPGEAHLRIVDGTARTARPAPLSRS